MSNKASGLHVEISEMITVGLFMAAIVPGYFWVRKGDDPAQMATRSAIVGAGLIAAALYTGFKARS